MTHVGLVAPLEGIEGDTELVAATRAALEDGVRELADTVRNSLNFYRTQESAETVELRRRSPDPRSRSPASSRSLGEQLSLPLEAARGGHAADDVDAGRLTVAAGPRRRRAPVTGPHRRRVRHTDAR